ncbi:MAG: CDP-alcohol phosphatidyltransferase family protein [Ilumatobacter sp.]|nr:CDP-alcohol phosphatidyltransferase family protein [Ilumatobacter sp.]
MLDLRLRPAKDRLLAPVADRLAGRVPPALLTTIGVLFSLAAAASAWWQQPIAAVACWLAGRLADGLDGAVARATGSAGDVGGYADFVVDTIGYAAIPLGIALGADDTTTWQIVAVLLAMFYVNAVSLLMLSALLEKRAAGAAARGEHTSVTMPKALVEGTETIIAFTIALAAPGVADVVFVVMAVGVGVGVVQRAVAARQLLGP